MASFQDKKFEQKMWDDISTQEGYSESPEEDYDKLYSLLLGDMKHKHLKILDVGCGTAIHSTRLAKLGHIVVGIDLSPEAIKLSKQITRKHGLKVKYLVGDIEKMPFANNSFDVVFCGTVLHHFPNLSNVAKELYRITKPGGYVLSYDPNALHPYGFVCHNVLNKIFDLKYFSKNERALYPSELRKIFGDVGYTNFEFKSLVMNTKKRSSWWVKAIRNTIYFLSDKLLWGLHKGIFLTMKAKKNAK